MVKKISRLVLCGAPGTEVSFEGEEVPVFRGIKPNSRWALRVLDMTSGGNTGQIISAKIYVVSR